MKRVLVTGGAGFIGGAVVRRLVGRGFHVVNLDKLTYAGNLDSLRDVAGQSNYRFVRADIGDQAAIADLLAQERIEAIMHLAAESHVDRSIDGPATFVDTNIVGTFALLQEALRHWRGLDEARKASFRFHHISTDEVFGSLGAEGFFREDTAYQPNSPYSASKAASDHLVRAWHHTYGLPTLMTNCSNNYGPYHFPEKLIPLMIINALEGKPLPVYGNGLNVRDLLYVDDHADALLLVAQAGAVGETYNIGGHNEMSNIAVVKAICGLVDEMRPDADGPRERLVTYVTDRPGHDARYAIDAGKIGRELGWTPKESFASGLRRTVAWYLNNPGWWGDIRSGVYRGERLGAA